MSDRITKHVSAMKEYGRKPYLVTKDSVPIGEKADYRYMMETTWHKAQDNEQIIVQSVKKKPYQNSDYETMEAGMDFIQPMTMPQFAWNFDWRFPNFSWDWRNPNPFPANRTSKDTQGEQDYTTTSPPKWIQCPTTVGASKSYVIIVKNASLTTKDGTTYYPASFSLSKASSDAKEFSLSNVVVRNSVTFVTLITSSTARGSIYISAKSGGDEITKKISISSSSLLFYCYAWDTSPTVYFRSGEDLVFSLVDFASLTDIVGTGSGDSGGDWYSPPAWKTLLWGTDWTRVDVDVGGSTYSYSIGGKSYSKNFSTAISGDGKYGVDIGGYACGWLWRTST